MKSRIAEVYTLQSKLSVYIQGKHYFRLQQQQAKVYGKVLTFKKCRIY